MNTQQLSLDAFKKRLLDGMEGGIKVEKVTCEFTFIGVELTVDKEYEVLDSLGVFHLVENDAGIVKHYPRSYFKKPDIQNEGKVGEEIER